MTIVVLGTSFPELVSSLIAVFKGFTEIVVANALGFNIANILLVYVLFIVKLINLFKCLLLCQERFF